MNKGIKFPMRILRPIKEGDIYNKSIATNPYTVYVLVVLYFEYVSEEYPIKLTLSEIWDKYHGSKCTKRIRDDINQALQILATEKFISIIIPKDNRQKYTIMLNKNLFSKCDLYMYLSSVDFLGLCNKLKTKELWLYLYLVSTINLETKIGFVGYKNTKKDLCNISKKTYYDYIHKFIDNDLLQYSDNITIHNSDGTFMSVCRGFCLPSSKIDTECINKSQLNYCISFSH